MTAKLVLAILCLFFGAVATLMVLVVGQDDKAIGRSSILLIVVWATSPIAFWVLWFYGAPLLAFALRFGLGVWRFILTGLFHGKD